MAETKQSPGNNRGHYTVYTPEQKAEIGRYAAEHGNLKSVCSKFSEEFGIEVKESTVRQFKKAYFVQLQEGKDPDQITAIQGKKRGRPSKATLTALTASQPSQLTVTSVPHSPGPSPVTQTVVVTADVNGNGSVPGEYEQMVGEMAISTCITVRMCYVCAISTCVCTCVPYLHVCVRVCHIYMCVYVCAISTCVCMCVPYLHNYVLCVPYLHQGFIEMGEGRGEGG